MVDHLIRIGPRGAVRANIDTRNLASLRLLERPDFVQKSLVLQADHFKGAASDELVFVRLEETIDPSSLP